MKIDVKTVKEIDKYIRTASGGTHGAFAIKLGISPSSLSRLIRFMRDLGAPIGFDRMRRTHFYTVEGYFSIDIQFVEKENAA